MLVRCIKAQVDSLENEITDLENEHSVTFDDSTLSTKIRLKAIGI